jgi:hypothetical protein
MTEVPPETGVTTPEVLPMVATAVVTLLHVPPGVVVERVMVEPIHTGTDPLMAAGVRFTVITLLVEQPADTS